MRSLRDALAYGGCQFPVEELHHRVVGELGADAAWSQIKSVFGPWYFYLHNANAGGTEFLRRVAVERHLHGVIARAVQQQRRREAGTDVAGG